LQRFLATTTEQDYLSHWRFPPTFRNHSHTTAINRYGSPQAPFCPDRHAADGHGKPPHVLIQNSYGLNFRAAEAPARHSSRHISQFVALSRHPYEVALQDAVAIRQRSSSLLA
jgi:hypothetical protein